MIHISVAEGLQRRFPLALAEVAVDELKAWTEKTRRYDKDIGKDVDEPNVHLPQYPYQPTVHQTVAIGRTVPLFLCHYPTLLSI